MDAKITNSNENKANPVNYSTQGFTGDPKFLINPLLPDAQKIQPTGHPTIVLTHTVTPVFLFMQTVSTQ